MKFQFEQRFDKSFARLPKPIQAKAYRALDRFFDNPYYPHHLSLHLKKMQGHENIWEGRVDRFYRFTFHFEKDADNETICVFRNIGPHSILDKNP